MELVEWISHLPVVFVYFNLLLFSCFSSYHIAEGRLGNATDHLALLQFKANIIHDPFGVLNSWNNSVHFCQWHGVTCGHRHQRVIRLELEKYGLMGSISPHLGNLSFLRKLNLAENNFDGEIPQQVWDLGRLQRLRLLNNSISGVLPLNLSCSSRLLLLDLQMNLLSGQIPDKLGCLSNLGGLLLWRNRLTGEIPPSLGNLTSLRALDLSRNNLTGVIPESFGQLKDLIGFSVEVNQLSGTPPPPIFNLSQIQVFSLLENHFDGTLPPELATSMPYMEFFAVGGNKFTGRIPPSLSNATYLQRLSIGDNTFTGSFPYLYNLHDLEAISVEETHVGTGGEGDMSFLCSLLNATHLETLAFGLNNFGGLIPTCIGNLSTNLKELTMQENKLWGQIPTAIGNLINLERLSMSENQLSGNIPSDIGNLDKLQWMFLSNNNLSGSIPSSFGNLQALNRLFVNGNNLHGSIPPSLGKCRSLIQLDLSENKLSGLIPPQLFDLAPFSIGINLAHNLLSGDFPVTVANLKQMSMLYANLNLLTGGIPNSIGACASLVILDMSSNLFQGIIPPSLSSLRGLEQLDLSHNNLTGEIPRFLVPLRLETLNLSHNNFEGVVPSQGIFLNKSIVFLNGNSKLCGGIPEFHLPRCNTHPNNRTWKKILLMTFLALGVIFVLLVIIFGFLRRKQKKPKPSEVEAPHQFLDLSYHELFRATNGFSSANLIGVGSFGSVYKGVLNQGSKLIAVKVLNLFKQGAHKTFISECEALKNVRHRNLVKILTVCSSIDQQGNDFKALICELMSNGSVDEWLHKQPAFTGLNQSQRFLTLPQRLNIAIDVACALDYLHNHCTKPIVHCDLKPSNVLLDDNMTAHLSDFGLAKFLPTIESESLQSGTSSIGIKGTVGYTPPEYGLGNEVSTYGDVYSYGVLLLEIFTGKRPIDEMFQDGFNLHQFAKGALPENVWKIIDPTLLYDNQELIGLSNIAAINKGSRLFNRIEECLILTIGIGVVCSVELPSERMNMSEVVAQLNLIKDKLLETRTCATQQQEYVGTCFSEVN